MKAEFLLYWTMHVCIKLFFLSTDLKKGIELRKKYLVDLQSSPDMLQDGEPELDSETGLLRFTRPIKNTRPEQNKVKRETEPNCNGTDHKTKSSKLNQLKGK